MNLVGIHGATPKAVVKYLRDRALVDQRDWQREVKVDPLHAFEWSVRFGVEACTMVEACEHMLLALDNGATPQHAVEQALRLARDPSSATGLLDAPLRAYRAAAWAKIADAIG